MSPFDRIGAGLRTARTLVESGALAPAAPDRAIRAALAYRHWGMSLATAFAVAGARFGDRVAVIQDERERSFADLDGQSDTRAAALIALGLAAPSKVVAILSRNTIEFVEATAALAKTGADTVYLNTGFSAAQLADVCLRENVELVLHDPEFSEVVVGISAATLALDDPWDDLAADPAGQRPDRPDRLGEPGRMIILTSGTTGTPKGAQRSQTASASAATALIERIPYRNGETMFIAAPMFHSWGFANLLTALMLGNRVIIEARFDPRSMLESMRRHRVNVLAAVPVMLMRLLDERDSPHREGAAENLRIAALSGSALPAGLAERFMDSFGDVIYSLYGSTEVGSVAIATPADLRAAPGTAGYPVRGTEIRILDDGQRDVAPGAAGSIYVRSELLFDGYSDGQTKASVDGYLSSGDVGHFDVAGRLFVDGRDDDMIISGGENVFPGEIERIIASMPGVREVAVVGVPDDDFGARLCAFVVREGKLVTADSIRTYVRDESARFKVPRDVFFLDELPRNSTGKVLRAQLRG